MASGSSHTMPNTEVSDVWNNQHGDTMLKGLFAAWKEGRYCDIKILVGKDFVMTHKIMLVSLSEYFKALLNMDVSDNQDSIELQDINFPILRALLEYGYTGKVSITGDNVQDLFIAADYLQVHFVKEACEMFMVQNMSLGNCVALMKFGYAFNVKSVNDHAEWMVGCNMPALYESDELMTMTPEEIERVLNRDGILLRHLNYVISEKRQELTYLKTILGYISRSPDIKDKVRKLLFSVRLPCINKNELVHEFQTFSGVLTKNDIDVNEVLEITEKWRLGQRENTPDAWAISRQSDLRSITSQRAKAYANGGQVRPRIRDFNYSQADHDPDNRLTSVTIIDRHWDGWVVVGGIIAKYSDGSEHLYGLSPTSSGSIGQNTLELEEDEVITDVTVRYGWMINCLTFHTSAKRDVGPFGGDVGGNVVKASGQDQRFLLGFKGSEVDNQGCKAVLNLSFIWMKYGEEDHEDAYEDSDDSDYMFEVPGSEDSFSSDYEDND